MVDPTLTFVEPMAMAFSKSADIPMESSRVDSGTPSAAATDFLQSERHVKFSGLDE